MTETAEEFFARDQVRRELGLELVSCTPGTATLKMLVTARMINSHGICHGGMIFTLADVVFGVASNTRPERFVGTHCTIAYLKPARLGQTLIATARERSRSGRTGVYDVTISLEEGTVVAEFMGSSRRIS